MNLLSIILGLWLALLPQQGTAQENQVQKTACTQAIGYNSIDELKKELLADAKRQAVNELFGELIAASSAVENFVLTSDQIRTSSVGFIRVAKEAVYFNSENFAETCVMITGYTTPKDRAKFEPLQLRKRQCITDPDLTTREIREEAKKESVIQALIEYDRDLEIYDDSTLLKLMQRIEFIDSGFVPETETYCTTVEGQVIPIEIIAALEFSDLRSDEVQVTEQVLELFTDSSWLSNHITSPGWQTLDFDDSNWLNSSIVTYHGWNRLSGMRQEANWIWNPQALVNEPILFRKSFEINGQSNSAEIHISGDNIYQIFVNGIDIGSDSEWEQKEIYDITEHLTVGKNVIAVQVIDVGAPGGLIAYAKITSQVSSEQQVSNLTVDKPANCEEIRSLNPEAKDGEYIIYINGEPDKTLSVYCHNMGTEPKEYVTLRMTDQVQNFSKFAVGGAMGGADVVTQFSKIRINPKDLVVDTEDFTFANTIGSVYRITGRVPNIEDVPYGYAGSCIGTRNKDGSGNIDLRGTGLAIEGRVIFKPSGWQAGHESHIDQERQIAEFSGGGYCGYNIVSEPFKLEIYQGK